MKNFQKPNSGCHSNARWYGEVAFSYNKLYIAFYAYILVVVLLIFPIMHILPKTNTQPFDFNWGFDLFYRMVRALPMESNSRMPYLLCGTK